MSTPGERWAAVLFDLDGTLADTVELILSSYRHTMRTHLGEAPPDERWLASMGTPLVTQLAGFAADEARTFFGNPRGLEDIALVPQPPDDAKAAFLARFESLSAGL